MPTLPISVGDSLFLKTFLPILTPKFGNCPISGKFCAIEVACNFENLSIFCLNPPYFLDVNVGISVTVAQVPINMVIMASDGHSIAPRSILRQT